MSGRTFTVRPSGMSNIQGIRKFTKSSVQSTNFDLPATAIYGLWQENIVLHYVKWRWGRMEKIRWTDRVRKMNKCYIERRRREISYIR
jgi:hypothetical protein